MVSYPPRFKRLLVGLLALVGLAGLAAAGYMALEPAYTVYDGQQGIVVSGWHATVGDVLAAAGVTLRAEDIVAPSLAETADPQTPIQIQRAQAVTLHTEQGARTYWTHQRDLAAFLAEVGNLPQRTDQIFADGVRVPFGSLGQTPLPHKVEIGRFLTITIQDGASQQTIRTAAQTVGAALKEAGLTIYAADGVQPPPGAWLTPNLLIRVQRSFPITLHVDGRIIHTRTHHTNALDVLAEAGIGLVGFDYSQPGPDVTLRPNDIIQVIRVTEDFRIQEEPIPYQTLWQATEELELDSRAVISYGQPGLKRQRIRVRYENGVEVSQTVDGEWIAREPVNEVMGYGTHLNLRSIDTPEGPREYWRVVRMRVTSYTAASAGRSPDDPRYGITASGVPAGYGVVAIDRSVVPFRSYVYVPGYGIGYAGDTGGGVRGRWIDLGYDEDNYVSWSGYVDVYYLAPPPPPDRINYLLPTRLP